MYSLATKVYSIQIQGFSSRQYIKFNGIVAMDLMWLDNGKKRKCAVLQVVNTQKHFQHNAFLKVESTRDAWDACIYVLLMLDILAV